MNLLVILQVFNIALLIKMLIAIKEVRPKEVVKVKTKTSSNRRRERAIAMIQSKND